MRNEIGSKLKIMVSFVKQLANEFEATKFEKFWKDKVDQVLIRDLTTNVNINNEAKQSDKDLNSGLVLIGSEEQLLIMMDASKLVPLIGTQN